MKKVQIICILIISFLLFNLSVSFAEDDIQSIKPSDINKYIYSTDISKLVELYSSFTSEQLKSMDSKSILKLMGTVDLKSSDFNNNYLKKAIKEKYSVDVKTYSDKLFAISKSGVLSSLNDQINLANKKNFNIAIDKEGNIIVLNKELDVNLITSLDTFSFPKNVKSNLLIDGNKIEVMAIKFEKGKVTVPKGMVSEILGLKLDNSKSNEKLTVELNLKEGYSKIINPQTIAFYAGGIVNVKASNLKVLTPYIKSSKGSEVMSLSDNGNLILSLPIEIKKAHNLESSDNEVFNIQHKINYYIDVIKQKYDFLDSNERIKLLKELGVSSIEKISVTNKYDENTKSAVLLVQKYNVLIGQLSGIASESPDGVYGKGTDSITSMELLDGTILLERSKLIYRKENGVEKIYQKVSTNELVDMGSFSAYSGKISFVVNSQLATGKVDAENSNAKSDTVTSFSSGITGDTTGSNKPSGKLGNLYELNKKRLSEVSSIAATQNHARTLERIERQLLEPINLNGKITTRMELVLDISRQTNLPPELIVGIWYRENDGLSTDVYMHNGQKLGRTTTIVPKGIYFEKDQFVEAAVDAFQNKYKKSLRDSLNLNSNTDDIVSMATFAEAYNGLGYYNRNKISPYSFAGTDVYQKSNSGMYIRDGVYSSTKKDSRLGIVAIASHMLQRDIAKRFDENLNRAGDLVNPNQG